MKVLMSSPDQTREIRVEWIECISTQGSYVIMPGHAPFIAQLAPHQVLSMKLRQGAIKSLVVTGGIMSVARDGVILILEENV